MSSTESRVWRCRELLCFFFQAEDGIRDVAVTGVQTCALPISYCDVALAETEEEKQAIAPMDALRPLLKHQLAQARQAILEMPQMPAEDWREGQIRRPTGDTQKLRVIFGGTGRLN